MGDYDVAHSMAIVQRSPRQRSVILNLRRLGWLLFVLMLLIVIEVIEHEHEHDYEHEKSCDFSRDTVWKVGTRF
jgi:hypothetical protein